MKWGTIIIGVVIMIMLNYSRNEGFNIIEVSVGPVSSNWERAIEVYYQLKGGSSRLW